MRTSSPDGIVEVSHLAHAHDGGRDRRIAQHPRGGVARQRHTDLVGQAAQLLHDLESTRRP
jgi:hypothetical protein